MSRLNIVVPTYNEAENTPKLIEALEAVLEGEDSRIIIVDDNSPDGTAQIAQNLNLRYGNILVHRRPGKLGLGSAIRDGMKIALSSPACEHIVTLDADGSHDPKDLPRLLAEAKNTELVQGSRYCQGGRIIGWGLRRRMQSRLANLLCKFLLGTQVNEHTTYFRVYSPKLAQTVVENVHSNKYDFAIASMLVAKDHNFTVKEVPITFVDRALGRSKLKTSDVLEWLYFVIRTCLRRLPARSGFKRFLKFCIVGASGILVNMGLLWLLTESLGLFYLYSALISIESSILSNFALNNLWTFGDRKQSSIGDLLARAAKYNSVCIAGLVINIGILYALTEVFGVFYLVSNLFGIAGATLWNFGMSTWWIWRVKRA